MNNARGCGRRHAARVNNTGGGRGRGRKKVTTAAVEVLPAVAEEKVKIHGITCLENGYRHNRRDTRHFRLSRPGFFVLRLHVQVQGCLFGGKRLLLWRTVQKNRYLINLVLARKAKNQYSWKGFQEIQKFLEYLKEEGLRGGDEDELTNENYNPIGSQQSNNTCSQPHSASSKNDNRREKSIGILTKYFAKLFLCTDAELITLDDAAKLLLGDGHNSAIMMNKVRRLYDITNVLSSMQLIEKTHQQENRKLAFKWLGVSKTIEIDLLVPYLWPLRSRKGHLGRTSRMPALRGQTWTHPLRKTQSKALASTCK